MHTLLLHCCRTHCAAVLLGGRCFTCVHVVVVVANVIAIGMLHDQQLELENNPLCCLPSFRSDFAHQHAVSVIKCCHDAVIVNCAY